ncbi:MAG: hypothetical protein SVU88_01650 [Candidatus Nanohaloarchaea archaeon]|nr:hypothetical protein [Candidatus Nanohaloarchaea archaeon]
MDHDPEADDILLNSDDETLRILGYGMATDAFTYDELSDAARLNGQNPVNDTLRDLERRGHVARNGDGTYHLAGGRFNGPRQREDGLDVLAARGTDSAVYRHVCDLLAAAPADTEAAVPAAYLDEEFPDRDWRQALSPFVMAGALRRRNCYGDDTPRLEPDGAAPAEDPVTVYQAGDPVYHRAAEAVLHATAPDDEMPGVEEMEAARP